MNKTKLESFTRASVTKLKQLELPPIKESSVDYELIEEEIKKLFRDEIYLPLIKKLDAPKSILNAKYDDFVSALKSGRIIYHDGVFKGRFGSSTSKYLKNAGAVWVKDRAAWRISLSKLPLAVKKAIYSSEAKAQSTFSDIQDALSDIMPEEIADKLNVSKLFDTALWKVNQKISDSLKAVSVAPKLTAYQSKKISDEYERDMKKYISEFTKTEIISLRKKIQESALSGIRYENLTKMIEESYGVSKSKAKFLARQETNLFVAKFKETRYTEAGVTKYIWKTVSGSKYHPVRPMHKALHGQTFSWDEPPVTDNKGSHNNPGQDFGCRCYAQPIVEF